jgi:hypothetical protein
LQLNTNKFLQWPTGTVPLWWPAFDKDTLTGLRHVSCLNVCFFDITYRLLYNFVYMHLLDLQEHQKVIIFKRIQTAYDIINYLIRTTFFFLIKFS